MPGSGRDRDHEDDPLRQYKEFNEDDPAFQVRILSLRVDALTKEKETIESDLKSEMRERGLLDDRVASMERTFQRGAGMMIALPFLGAAVGLLLAYGKMIFAPWTGVGK